MALTEWYVTDAGVGDGSLISTPMSMATFQDHMATGGAVNAVAGARYNIKAGSYASRTTTTDAWVNGGNATSPVIVRGYAATPGDGYLGRDSVGVLTSTNFPTITYTTGRLNSSSPFLVIECLNITSGASAPTVTLASNNVCRACKITNSSTNASAAGISLATSTASVVHDCDVLLPGGGGGSTAISALGAAQFINASRLIGSNSAVGITTRSSVKISRCTIAHFATGVFVDLATANLLIDSNTITACTGDGIDIITTLAGLVQITNNLIADNGGYGIDCNSAASPVFLSFNRFRDNSLGVTNLGTDWVSATNFEAVTTGGGSTDFTNSGSNDFSLIAASPATSAGVPPSASIGALQRDQTSAPGGSTASSFTFAQ